MNILSKVKAGNQILSHFEKASPLFFILIVSFVFNTLLVGRFFPITEGWFQDYNRYISEGRLMYKDFYMFLTPVFPYIMWLVEKVFGSSLIAFRYYGIVERLILISLVYNIISRLYSPKISFVAVLTASVIYISNIQDVFYGYYQTSLLFVAVNIWLAIKLYDNLNRRYTLYSVLFGLSLGITFLTKQSTGFILGFCLSLTLIFLSWMDDKRRIWKCILISIFTALLLVGLFVGILIQQGIFTDFVNQVFVGSSSKGSLGTIFFSFIPRILTLESLVLLFGLLFVFVLPLLPIRIRRSKLNYDTVSKITILIFILLILKFLVAPFFDISRITFPKISVVVLFSIFSVSFLSVFLFVEPTKHRVQFFAFYGILGTLFIMLLLFISEYKCNVLNFNKLRIERQSWIYALFFLELIYLCFLVVQKIVYKSKSNDIKIIVLMSAWLIMYVHGMSHMIEDHGTLFAFSVFLAELLTLKSAYNRLKDSFVIVFCLVMFVGIFIQRNELSYWWWGVNNTPATYEAKYTFDDPLLHSLHSDKKSTHDLNEIYHLVQLNKRHGDLMYTFPHLNYFNVMAHMDSPAKAKVHYFDVCPDFMAQEDAKRLYMTKPQFLIWQNLSEEVWRLHEDIFRSGKPSGQRAIQKFYRNVTADGSYTLLGVYTLSNADSIYVWGLNDGRIWRNARRQVITNKVTIK